MIERKVESRPALAEGDVVAGRFVIERAAVEPDAVWLARDLGHPGSEVEIAAWAAGPEEIPAEVARLKRVAQVRDPALAPLVDFGCLEGADTIFAVAEPAAGEPLAEALAGGRIDATLAVREALALAAALAAERLPLCSLAPALLRVRDGALCLSALTVARHPAGIPESPSTLAQVVLATMPQAARSPLRRLLERWLPGTRLAAEALADLRRLGIGGARADTEPRFTGRETELRSLEQRLADLIEAGRGGLIAVLGPPGIGKSRLLRHFRLGVRAALVTEVEVSGSMPRGASAALAPLVLQLASYAPPAFLWRHGIDLALVAPELGAKESAARPTGTSAPETLRLRLLEAVARLVREVAIHRPLVLRLSDLHQADAATMALLRPIAVEAARNPEGSGCLVLLEARSGVAQSADVESLLTDLRRAPGYSEVALGGLSAQECQALLARVTGSPPPSHATAEALRRLTFGNPMQIVAATRERLRSPAEPSPAATLPADELAVLGPAAAGSASLSGAERERLHARAAEVAEPTAEVVRHLEAAGQPEHALAAAVAAARRARGAHAEREALDLLRLAIARAPQEGRLELLREAAQVAALLGDTEDALAHLTELDSLESGKNPETLLERARLLAASAQSDQALAMLERLEDEPAGGIAARSALLRARILLGQGCPEEAESEARRARKLVARDPHGKNADLLGEADQVLGSVCLARGEVDSALRFERSALARLDGDTLPHRRVQALTRLGNVHFARGDLDQALARYQEAQALAERHEHCFGVAEAIGNSGAVYFNRGDIDEARRHFERSLDLRERVGDTAGSATTLANLGLVATAQGRFEDGRRLFAQAEEAADRHGDRATLAFTTMSRGLLECDSDALEEASATLARALELAQGSGDRRLEMTARALLAEVLVRRGEFPEARRQAERALKDARAARASEPQGLALRALALVAAHRRLPRMAPSERYFRASLRAFERVSNRFEADKTLRYRSAFAGEPAAADPAPVPAVASLLPVVSGDIATDRKNLRLLVDAMCAERSAGEAAALGRLAEAAAARWSALARLSYREGADPVASVLAVHGRLGSARLAAAVAEAATAVARTPAGRGPLPLDEGDRGAVLCLPLYLPGDGSRASGFALVGLGRGDAAPPAGVLEALARPLRAQIARADLGRPERRLRAPGDGFGGIVGRTPPMRKLFSLLERVVGNELPVLIIGESGTGKELVARAIHGASGRREGAFVPIDCAAIPESLIESELFGHRRGAFTGTTSDRTGLFEEASGGTVLLDEVANIPASVQAKLLRVLQEREVRRVGDTTLRPIDVRVIAASNRSLEAAVREGTFREDLYFRLHVIEIQLPPLRERLDDVPLLVEHFLGRLADPPPRIERAALDRLLGFDWPGNVRELENELRRAFALSRGSLIREADLSRIVAENRPRPVGTAELPRLRDAVATLERELVERTLQSTGHHRARTARLLGLSHQGLINKIRKYRIRTSARRKNDQPS